MPQSNDVDRIENPVTGETIVFRVGVGEPSAPTLGLDFTLQKGGGVFVPHLHRHQTETIHVRRGRLRAGLPGAQREVGPGEHIVLTPGTGHTLENVSDGPLESYVEFQPAGGAERFLRNYFGLCREGRCDRKGNPALLQVALLMPAHDNWRADIPLLAQRVLFAILGPVARLLGYRAHYSRFARGSHDATR